MIGTAMRPLLTTDFPDLTLFRRGKVRDVYDVGDHLLFVATDRLSAFDVVLPDPIPMKGAVLTAMSEFWFELLDPITRHHLVSTRIIDYPAACTPYAAELQGRSMLVKKTQPVMIEAIVRGYLTGSGLKEYQASGTVCGIPLPDGLVDGSRLPEPLFTPSTKAEIGAHDENISFEQAANIVGREVAERVRELSLAIYTRARDAAFEKGIIIADTKFEFGFDGNDVILIDEVLTPDSSRFWPVMGYAPGKAQPSFDKQFVRDYLTSIGWNKQPPAPPLPQDIIDRTTDKYLEAYRLLTGASLR